jgi:4-hydroxybenzoate polyprenyltransferase
MKNISIESVIEQAKEIKSIALEKWTVFAENKFVQSVRLDKPLTILVMMWPALWGFFYASGGFLNFLKLIILMVTLRIICFLYDDIATPEIEVTGNRRQMNKPPLYLLIGAVIFSAIVASQIFPGVLFLVLTWIVLVAIYPYLFKIIWWPQIYGGVIFGLWPALIGITAAGEISFNSILICFAAFAWMISLETLKAGEYKSVDMANSLKSVALWMGNKSISFVVSCFILTFVFLVLSGMANHASGIYYAFLMVAQWMLIRHYHGEKEAEMCQKTYAETVWVSLLITLGILFGI